MCSQAEGPRACWPLVTAGKTHAHLRKESTDESWPPAAHSSHPSLCQCVQLLEWCPSRAGWVSLNRFTDPHPVFSGNLPTVTATPRNMLWQLSKAHLSLVHLTTQLNYHRGDNKRCPPLSLGEGTISFSNVPSCHHQHISIIISRSLHHLLLLYRFRVLELKMVHTEKGVEMLSLQQDTTVSSIHSW